MSKKILVLDFDGVLHSYTSGWCGAAVISDAPVAGMAEFLTEAIKHFEVLVFSSRSMHDAGIRAMQEWLGRYLSPEVFYEISFPTHKPPAFVTIDDRAITFTGEWPSMDSLLNFKPWNN